MMCIRLVFCPFLRAPHFFISGVLGVCLLMGSIARAEPYTGDIVYGATDAPVTVVEYASLGCPACRVFHETVWPDLKKTYIDTGHVKFIFQVFPLHVQDLRAETLARCGGRDRYDAFIDVLFRNQREWRREDGFMDALNRYALQGGVSGEQYAACQEDDVLQQSILDRRNGAIEAGARSTPSFKLPNGRIVSSVQTMENWAEILGTAHTQAETGTVVIEPPASHMQTYMIAYIIGGVLAIGGVFLVLRSRRA